MSTAARTPLPRRSPLALSVFRARDNGTPMAEVHQVGRSDGNGSTGPGGNAARGTGANVFRSAGRTRVLKIVEAFQNWTQQSMRYAETNLTAISILAVVCFPLYYFVWNDLFPQKYENISLRLLGSALWILILLRDRWPRNLRSYFSICYYFTVLYSLPFFFTFMVLKNESSTSWVMSNLAAIFLLILLVDWLNVVILFVIGSILGWVCYVFTTSV